MQTPLHNNTCTYIIYIHTNIIMYMKHHVRGVCDANSVVYSDRVE